MNVKQNIRRQNLGPAFSDPIIRLKRVPGRDRYRLLLPRGLGQDEREAWGGMASAASQRPQIPNTGLIH